MVMVMVMVVVVVVSVSVVCESLHEPRPSITIERGRLDARQGSDADTAVK